MATKPNARIKDPKNMILPVSTSALRVFLEVNYEDGIKQRYALPQGSQLTLPRAGDHITTPDMEDEEETIYDITHTFEEENGQLTHTISICTEEYVTWHEVETGALLAKEILKTQNFIN
ncbi:MAG: hypothetical protein ACHQNE_00360 [Candidatus Kapaibacterium sp.]